MLFIKRKKPRTNHVSAVIRKYSANQMKKALAMKEDYLRRIADHGNVDEGLVPAPLVKDWPYAPGEVLRVVLGATSRKMTSTKKAMFGGPSSSRKLPNLAMNEEHLRRRADHGDVDEGLVPAPPVKVRPIAAGEVFRVVSGATGRKKTSTKAAFVGPSSSRKHPKHEPLRRSLRLRCTSAYVTHPQNKCIFLLKIIGVKKNPIGLVHTTLGTMTRGTIIKVNVGVLALVTAAGEEVREKDAQVTNDPDIDGFVNAVLLV